MKPEAYQRAIQDRPVSDQVRVLVLSGGGSNGAWGAGFLKGWAERQDRKPFDVVTGVSTGALLATGALLGRDDMLAEAYLTTSNRDVQRSRWWFTLPFSNSLRDSRPLRKLIERYLPEETIDEVARVASAEHPRLVYAASVNLDTGKLVIWNLSAIAQAHDYKLYRDVVYASASAPVLFPPVSLGGRLHVDGGARAQLFFRNYLLPGLQTLHRLRVAAAATQPATAPVQTAPTIFVIVNSELDLPPECTDNCLVPVTIRSLSCLMNANSAGSIYETLYHAAPNHFDVKISSIPDGKSISSFDFDPVAMQKLYELARTNGQAGHFDPPPPPQKIAN